jgi:hypothetical protein
MRNVGLKLVAGFVCAVCFAGLVVAAEFSADMVQSVQGMTFNGKIHVKGKKMRMEMDVQGMKSIVIIDMDTGTMTTVMPAQKMYMQISATKELAQWSGKEEDYEKIGAVRKKMGEEKVNGQDCEKYLITYKDAVMGKMYQWFSAKLEWPVKIAAETPQGKMTYELKNIKEGEVDDSVFEIPAGYQKMEIPVF